MKSGVALAEVEEEEEEDVSAVKGTPLRFSLLATRCGMRREKQPALTVKRGLQPRTHLYGNPGAS